jgi:hypothetical protein
MSTTEIRYADLVRELRSDAKAGLIMITNVGGDLIDYQGLCSFWDRLKPDIPDEAHKIFTRAWLATCVIPKDAEMERRSLRTFIEGMAKLQGWTRE